MTPSKKGGANILVPLPTLVKKCLTQQVGSIAQEGTKKEVQIGVREILCLKGKKKKQIQKWSPPRKLCKGERREGEGWGEVQVY